MTTSIKKEIMEEFKKKFVMKSMYGNHINFHADPVLDFLSLALTRVEEAARKEERERIAKAMQPAFDDFNAAAKTMIKTDFLKRTGTEIIENIGYMKSLLLSPSEEKKCECHCHAEGYPCPHSQEGEK